MMMLGINPRLYRIGMESNIAADAQAAYAAMNSPVAVPLSKSTKNR